MRVTATSFRTTSFDQILSPRGVDGSEAAKATRFPIETVAKLKGKDPMRRVMKNGLRGRRRTPEMTYGKEIKSALFEGQGSQVKTYVEYGIRKEREEPREEEMGEEVGTRDGYSS